MRKIKNKIKIFLKTLYLSGVIVFCFILGFSGICKAYENIRLIGFGEYRNAIEISDGTLKFFDYELVLKKS